MSTEVVNKARLMYKLKIVPALFLLACADIEAVDAVEVCDADAIVVERPVDCVIIDCEIDDDHAECTFALWLPPGSEGQIGVRVPGTTGLHWHEAPWYLEASDFDDPRLHGRGLECGSFSMDLTSNWQESIELSCTRYGAGGGASIDTWSP